MVQFSELPQGFSRWIPPLKLTLSPFVESMTPVVNRMYVGAAENLWNCRIDHAAWTHGDAYGGNMYVALYADNGETPEGGKRLWVSGVIANPGWFHSLAVPNIFALRGLLYWAVVYNTATVNAHRRVGGGVMPSVNDDLVPYAGCRADLGSFIPPPDPCPSVTNDVDACPAFALRRVL